MRFGRLLVLSTRSGKHTVATCRCDCGTVKDVRMSVLLSGDAVSCGCWRSERITLLRTKHGETRSVEWMTWRSMHQRCEDVNCKGYRTYGARGIFVCARWSGEHGFENFLAADRAFSLSPVSEAFGEGEITSRSIQSGSTSAFLAPARHRAGVRRGYGRG